jgi:hypothetical protein
MPAKMAPSWRRLLALSLALLAPLVGAGVSTPAAAQDAPVNKPILAPPPSRWDRQMLSGRPLLSQTVSDLTAVTAGIAFGMGPGEVNTHMPNPAKGIAWTALPAATEFTDDVRYFWIRFEDARDLRMGATACAGTDSYIVFLFQPRGLFRISYRLVPDVACPRPADAAEEIFGRYVSISTDIALSVHYRAGATEIVDVTDPTAGYLLATRWQPRAAK